MNQDKYITIILIGLAVFVVMCLVVMFTRSAKARNNYSEARSEIKESFKYNDFIITNHLLQPISIISIDEKTNSADTLIKYLGGKSKDGISFKKLSELIITGRKLRVYILNSKTHEIDCLFSDYDLDICEGKTIKALHVGMNTSRWVGADSDSTFIPAGNAVQGRPYVRLHNRTRLTLNLSDNVVIPPNGTALYKGRDHFGVRIGTIFEDTNQILQPYKMIRPATDIYFGVTSDLLQPLFGGWQIDSEFDDEADEPHYLLEAGWMGGPANGDIKPGFIPSQSSDIDEWGIKK